VQHEADETDSLDDSLKLYDRPTAAIVGLMGPSWLNALGLGASINSKFKAPKRPLNSATLWCLKESTIDSSKLYRTL
jgi:hypothetical protein